MGGSRQCGSCVDHRYRLFSRRPLFAVTGAAAVACAGARPWLTNEALLSETESGHAPAGTATGGEVSILIDGSASSGKVTRFRVSRTSMCAVPLRAWRVQQDSGRSDRECTRAPAASAEQAAGWAPAVWQGSMVETRLSSDARTRCCWHAAQGLSWQGHQAPGGGGLALASSPACAACAGWRSAGGPQQLEGQPDAGGRRHAARRAQPVTRQPEPPSTLTCTVIQQAGGRAAVCRLSSESTA